MMHRTVRTAVICVLMLLVTLLSVVMPLSAEETESVRVIEDFEDGISGWHAGDNVKQVLPADFYEAMLGEGAQDEVKQCLFAQAYELDVNLIRSVTAEFSKIPELTEYRAFSYDMYALPYELDPQAEYLTRLTLTSVQGDSFEHFDYVLPGQWCTVTADISEWAGRAEIAGAEISLVIGTDVREFNANSFFLDDIRAEDPVDRRMTSRFLFDRFETMGGSAAVSGDLSMITLVPMAGQSMTFEAAVFPPEVEHQVNCLRFKLANHTDNESMTIRYSTFDTSAMSEEKSVTIALDKQSGERYYYAYVGDVTKLRRISLRFGSGGGRIELDSVSAVSMYTPEVPETHGKITGCMLRDDLSTVTFSGEVLREEALANAGGSIRIYTIPDGRIPAAAELSKMEPVVTSPMTTRFELSCRLPQKSIAELQRMYLAVSVRTDGSYALIAPPFQVQNPERAATAEGGFVRGAKGFIPSDFSLIGETGTGVTVLTLDIREAFGTKSVGDRYSYNGEVYYFNPDYFEKTDAKIRLLHDTGCAVLLRFTGFTEEAVKALADSYASDPYIDYAHTSGEEDGTDYLGALSAYTANQWAATGTAAGAIVGEYANLLGEGMDSMEEAVTKAARELRTVYNNFVARNASARVYLSVSDLYTSDPATGEEELGLCEFIPSLLAETAKNGSFGWGICVDSIWRLDTSAGAEHVSVWDCGELVRLLDENEGQNVRLLFCDTTYQKLKIKFSEALTTFVRGYYAAYFNERVDAYIAHTNAASDTIQETVKAIDTADAKSISDLVLTLLDAEKWTELVPGYDTKKLPGSKVTLYPATLEAPSGIKGAYSYYSFDNFTGVGALKPGFHCGTLSVEDGSVLMAPLGADSDGMWMGVMHRFEYPENLSLTPVLEITVRLDETDPADVKEVPFKLVLLGDGERFESQTTVPVGEWTTVYVYTGDFGKIRDTESLQLLAGGASISSAVMRVKSIRGLSRDYTDESLESVIAEERLKKQSGDTDPRLNLTPYIWVGGFAFIAVATIITVALLSRRKERRTDE